MSNVEATRAPTGRPPFGRWLLAQSGRDGMIGDLAKHASKDPRFPKDGDFEEVAKRLNSASADPDRHEALADAELDWAAH